MLPSQLFTHRLSRIHRTWWVLACLSFTGLWLSALVLHSLFTVFQYEELIHHKGRKLFDSLMERRLLSVSETGTLMEVRQDRDFLISSWIPHRLQEEGLGKDAKIECLSRKQANDWMLKRGPSQGRPSFLAVVRNLSLRRLEFEYLLPVPKAPDFERPPLEPPRPEFGKRPPFGPHPPRSLPPDVEYAALVHFPLLPILFPILIGYGVALLIGGAILWSFSFSLRVTQRGIEQELAIAHAKANFTAMVSHELKTPVAVLRMYAEMLRDGLVTDPAKQEEFHRTMAFEAIRLQRLIQNLLDLGKVQSGARSYQLAPEDPNELISGAKALALALFPDRKGEVYFEEAECPPILADREVAVQAISNVIHNALKYGEGHPVEIQPRRDGPFLALDVLDRGPGIPPEQRERIFEPYVRIGAEETRTSQGTGLGLALVKAYMEGHGGSVLVTERPGGGSIFSLRFRMAGKGDSP